MLLVRLVRIARQSLDVSVTQHHANTGHTVVMQFYKHFMMKSAMMETTLIMTFVQLTVLQNLQTVEEVLQEEEEALLLEGVMRNLVIRKFLYKEKPFQMQL